jgi:SPP1 family predicted phage head-tail adaptor
MLSIGQLDRRIRILEPTSTTDSYGERIETWATAYTVWAKVDWKSSDRKEDSQEQVQGTDVVFYVRNLGVTILSNYRISFDSETYIIHGIKQIDGRERFLELETKIKDNN